MSPHPRRTTLSLLWSLAEYLLLAIWVLAALICMYPGIGRALRLEGSFFTSYAADLAFPPWFYIQLRRRPWRVLRAVRWFGGSPQLAAISIFIVGALTEFSQIYWPRGFFGGVFDPLDIAAYAAGLIICCLAEKLCKARIHTASSITPKPSPASTSIRANMHAN